MVEVYEAPGFAVAPGHLIVFGFDDDDYFAIAIGKISRIMQNKMESIHMLCSISRYQELCKIKHHNNLFFLV